VALAAAPLAIGFATRPAKPSPPSGLRTVSVQQLAAAGLDVEAPIDQHVPGWVDFAASHGIPRSVVTPFIEQRLARPGVPTSIALAAAGRGSADYTPVESTLAYVSDTRTQLGPCPPGRRFCRHAQVGDRQLCYLVVTDHLRSDGTIQRLVMVIDASNGRLLTQITA
jgi:hypothetical protein